MALVCVRPEIVWDKAMLVTNDNKEHLSMLFSSLKELSPMVFKQSEKYKLPFSEIHFLPYRPWPFVCDSATMIYLLFTLWLLAKSNKISLLLVIDLQ